MQKISQLVCSLLFSISAIAETPDIPKAQPIDVQSYVLKLELDPESNLTEFKGTVEIELRAVETISQIVLNAEEMTVNRVFFARLGKKELTFRQPEGKKILEIDLEKPLPKGRPVVVRVDYTAKVNAAHYGLFKVVDPDDAARGNLFFTQLEAEGARRFFPCNDVPSDKATTEIEVATPAKMAVVSNGKQVFDRPFTKAGQKWHRVNWRQGKPHPTYLVALAVAPLTKLTQKHKGLELSLYVGAKKAAEAQFLFKAMPKLMDLHESLLKVKYPWDKYAVVGVPTFVWGGMENTSVTLQNEGASVLIDPRSTLAHYRVIGLAGHELAHQWFGDLVTPNGWDDIWLNEAFATYTENRISKSYFNNEYPDLVGAVSIWEEYFRQEDGPRSHPIVEKNKQGTDAFDSISYEKGAQVLKTLEIFVGDEKFKKGLTEYLKKFSLKNANRDDFFDAIAKSAGEPLDEFKNAWIFQRGYPVVTQEGTWNAEKKSFALQLRQRSNHLDDKTIFRFRMPVVFHRNSTPAFHRAILVEMGVSGSPVGEQTVSLPEAPEWITVNPTGRVLAKFDSSASLATLETQMKSDPEPLTRLWAAREVAKPLFQGKSLSGASEAALARWLRSEPSPYVRASLLVFFQRKYFRYLPEKLANTVQELAEMILGKDLTVASAKKYETSSTYLSDPDGWRLFEAEVLGTLGKVEKKEMLPYLAAILGKHDLSLDDVGKASVAVAQLGSDQAGEVLKAAAKTHGDRGHAYRVAINGAYGAWENPKAAAEMRTMAKTCGPDLPSRWARLVKDNSQLRESPAWSDSLKDILLTEDHLGEEVKSRLLSTVEEVATDNVFQMATDIRKETKSERLKEQATKMIKKNFPNKQLL